MIYITFLFRCLDVTGKNRRILELPWLYQSVLIVVGHVVLVAFCQNIFDGFIWSQSLTSKACKLIFSFFSRSRINRSRRIQVIFRETAEDIYVHRDGETLQAAVYRVLLLRKIFILSHLARLVGSTCHQNFEVGSFISHSLFSSLIDIVEGCFETVERSQEGAAIILCLLFFCYNLTTCLRNEQALQKLAVIKLRQIRCVCTCCLLLGHVSFLTGNVVAADTIILPCIDVFFLNSVANQW